MLILLFPTLFSKQLAQYVVYLNCDLEVTGWVLGCQLTFPAIFHFLPPIQIERHCRRQNKSDSKTELYVGKSRKHCGKWRKCWLPAFSPFLTLFSKGFFPRGVKSRDYFVKSKMPHDQSPITTQSHILQR